MFDLFSYKLLLTHIENILITKDMEKHFQNKK